MGSLPIGISGSRAAVILGMSPWATPFSVWQDIMEGRTPRFNKDHKYDYEAFEGNASTRWGLAFEDAIIKLAEGLVGREIVDRELAFGKAFVTPRVTYAYKAVNDVKCEITCHIDGRYDFLNDGKRQILHEGKTTTAYGFGDKWGEPGTDKIPVEYQIQVQHQMLCTGADTCIVSVLVFPKRPDDWEAEGWETIPQSDGSYLLAKKIEGGDFKGCGHVISPDVWATTLAQMGYFHQYTIPANHKLQALMLDKYRVWWTKYILGKTPPEPANYADIRAMITEPVGTIIVDDDTARWFTEYKSIGSEIGAGGNLAKRRDQLKVLILTNARALESTLDDESTDKWIFRNDKGDKLGSYGRTAKGNMVFR